MQRFRSADAIEKILPEVVQTNAISQILTVRISETAEQILMKLETKNHTRRPPMPNCILIQRR